MNVLEWFGVGVGVMATLWWWRYLVRYVTYWETAQSNTLYHSSDKYRRVDPQFATGFFGGTLALLVTPVLLVVELMSLLSQQEIQIPAPKVYVKMLKGPS